MKPVLHAGPDCDVGGFRATRVVVAGRVLAGGCAEVGVVGVALRWRESPLLRAADRQEMPPSMHQQETAMRDLGSLNNGRYTQKQRPGTTGTGGRGTAEGPRNSRTWFDVGVRDTILYVPAWLASWPFGKLRRLHALRMRGRGSGAPNLTRHRKGGRQLLEI